MKNLIFGFIILLTQTSCCSTKDVVKQEPVHTIAQVETPEPPKAPEANTIKTPKNVKITPKNEAPEIVKEPKIIETTDTQVDYATPEATEAFNHNEWSNLLFKYVTKQGNVNYKGFKNDHNKLRDYISSLGQNMPNKTWTKEDKLAYWINAYNAMTVDLIVRNYPIKSIKDIKDPWEQRLWKLGSKWYNLDEIEHQILRKMNEPRIHFGIVCASFSCPKLLNQAYTASNLDAQLTQSTKDFLSDTNRNNISANNIKISKIFQWFSKDFKKNGSLIGFLNKYSSVQISFNAKKSYKSYNWDLNE